MICIVLIWCWQLVFMGSIVVIVVMIMVFKLQIFVNLFVVVGIVFIMVIMLGMLVVLWYWFLWIVVVVIFLFDVLVVGFIINVLDFCFGFFWVFFVVWLVMYFILFWVFGGIVFISGMFVVFVDQNGILVDVLLCLFILVIILGFFGVIVWIGVQCF